MSWFNFIIQVNLFLLVFYGFYIMLLRNETFFNLNRAYLVGASICSFLIPVLRSDWVKSLFLAPKVGELTQVVMSNAEIVVFAEQDTGPALIDILTAVYLTGVVVCAARFLFALYSLTSVPPSAKNAYSFFYRIVVSADVEGRDSIMKHEEVHARHFHSADVIWFELVAIVNWFNPVVYLYKRSITHIHEYIADEATASKTGKSKYALLLLSNAMGIKPKALANSFFNESLLKRRILMLQKARSAKVAILKYGLSVPLFMLAAVISTAAAEEKIEQIQASLELPSKEVFTTQNEPKPGPVKEETREIRLRLDDSKTTLESVERSFPTVSNGLHKDEIKPLQDSSIYDFSKVDKLPEFPGGIEKFYKFVGNNYQIPAILKEKGVKGRLIATFVVEKDGTLSGIRSLRDLGHGTGEELVRVLQSGGKWIPGVANGKPVRIQYTLPVMLNSQTLGNGDFMIRGDGLDKAYILLDGKPISREEMLKIDSAKIESIRVIKEDVAEFSQYNVPEGKEGLILITSKKQ
ncbi:M56 family metallopeptidase [Pedobacter sp. SYSU D00535]|uniref:M56 family metallopeptidase n=1 Tax=Pedobacter sp. SYSU D00535 TaxID=2810308 RepID=UPI001A967BCA|nr:M56 family metallopeptidase [Pedobacter sp. SYSU D00535]